MVIVQVSVLLLLLLFLRSRIRISSLSLGWVLSGFLALIFTLQLSSVILTGNVADYRFYENFQLSDVISVADFFGVQGLLIVLTLVLATFCIQFLGRRIGRQELKTWASMATVIICLVILSLPGGIIYNAYETIRLKSAGDASFNDALASLDITEDDYVLKEGLSASPGKNIIVLSLESLEIGFLGDKLDHLTPNLSKLARENTMFPMIQCPAGGWTSASMYIAMTGVPAYFGTHGNSVFQNSAEHKLTTLPDVLQKAGYNLKYFIGKKEYSGINDMLAVFGFTVKSEKDFENKYPEVPWGMQDMDLFEELKNELLHSKNSGKPFAYFLSTIGTHFPNGVPDSRVDSILPPQKSRLELMVSATDYYVGQLIDFLRDENMLNNTVFYIYPDHLLMGTNARVFEDIKERSLYLISNANQSLLPYTSSDTIYQIDIPKIILAGAEIEHNAKFLTDYIPGQDKIEFLRVNDKQILQLNDAALRTYNLKDGFQIVMDEEKSKFVLKNKDEVVLASHPMPEKGFGHRIFIESDIRPVGSNTFELNKPAPAITTPYFLDFFRVRDTLYASLKGKQDYGILKRGELEVSFDSEDISLVTHLKIDEAIKERKEEIKLESNSWNARKASSFTIRDEKHLISRGLTLIHFYSRNKWEYKTFDTYGSPDDAIQLLNHLKELVKNGGRFCLLAHDSAAQQLASIASELEKIGLVKLASLKGREAYLMDNLTSAGIREKIASNTLNETLTYPSEVKDSNKLFRQEKYEFSNSTDRYIAHAGGNIDGVKYTNSLEALDKSYESGFRQFELDIIETSDGHFVAAHDWKHWAKETNYQGEVPVSLQEFKKHKIRGKYTTLDIEAINEWFAAHPDAILVTDKVNDPNKFKSSFKHKGRLWMELFTLEALEEARNNNITAMASEAVWSKLGDSIIPYLKRQGITHATLSRRNVEKKRALLEKLNKEHIKAYVYHVNFDKGKDEEYVFYNELGLVYGMYADNWIPLFSQSPGK